MIHASPQMTNRDPLAAIPERFKVAIQRVEAAQKTGSLGWQYEGRNANSLQTWSGRRGSNPRPTAWEGNLEVSRFL